MRKINKSLRYVILLSIIISAFSCSKQAEPDDGGNQVVTVGPENERTIIYQTKDGAAIDLLDVTQESFGANILSNTYSVEGFGRIVFDAPPQKIVGHVFQDCTTLVSIILPDSITEFFGERFARSGNFGDGVIVGQFEGCKSLESISLPSKLKSIGECTFYGCERLKAITIPDGVKEIGPGAFAGCGRLASITLPNSLETIGMFAFEACSSLLDIIIPSKVSTIENSTFTLCTNLISVSIPERVSRIGQSAFAGCKNLTSVSLPDALEEIEDRAFISCSSIKTISIPDNVMMLGRDIFSGCSKLTSVILSSKMTQLSDELFRGCSNLKHITIPEYITNIGIATFYGCSSLESIVLPESVTGIGVNAFVGCHNPISMTIRALNPPSIANEGANKDPEYQIFSFPAPEGISIYVPAESVEAYKAAYNGSVKYSWRGYDYSRCIFAIEESLQ